MTRIVREHVRDRKSLARFFVHSGGAAPALDGAMATVCRKRRRHL